MPELPDLVHIVHQLAPRIAGRRIESVETGDPVVFRLLLPGTPAGILTGRTITGLRRHGPFLHFQLDQHELIMHLMLAGRLKLVPKGGSSIPQKRLALGLDDSNSLQYGDDRNMGKLYFCDPSQHAQIPLFDNQGVDVTSPAFTFACFEKLITRKRTQVRVFIMDQSLISAIGNAYADEILFSAGLHPKTPCNILTPGEHRKLFDAILTTLSWAINEVAEADRPIEEKVRGHLRVRNRAGHPCTVCSHTIRREQVHGHDTFYCPHCQPDRTGHSLPWNNLENS